MTRRALARWFGFVLPPEPKDEMGRPLQEKIVAEAMRGEPVLGILPTGTGKSVCYQIPALAKFQKTGALTVVISPLVALMADQVRGPAPAWGLRRRRGERTLSLPERHDVLDRVRMGDAAILLISPEQLRNPSVRGILKQREIGYWVIDEAHCLSKWGQDFRPDYRYISRFIREYSGDDPPAPLHLPHGHGEAERPARHSRPLRRPARGRAAADQRRRVPGQPRLRGDRDHQRAEERRDPVAADQRTCPSATPRAPSSTAPPVANGRRGGVPPSAGPRRRSLPRRAQARRRRRRSRSSSSAASSRVIAATNAFGMGIDKPDIRLVIHADIPGLAGELRPGGRPRRTGPQACALRAALLQRRHRAAVQAIAPLAAVQARDRRHPARAPTARRPHEEDRRGDRHPRRDHQGGTRSGVRTRQRHRRYPREDRGCLARRGHAASREENRVRSSRPV